MTTLREHLDTALFPIERPDFFLNVEEYFDVIEKAVRDWLKQINDKRNYLTTEELEMSRRDVNQQVALGLRSCETIGDVCELLDDIRHHERYVLSKTLSLCENKTKEKLSLDL